MPHGALTLAPRPPTPSARGRLTGAALSLALAACTGSRAPSTPASGASTSNPNPAAPAPAARAASVIYTATGTATGDSGRQVMALVEDGSGAAVALSAAGADATFVATLPGRRILLVEAWSGANPTVARVVSITVDGGDRQVLASFVPGRYRAAGKAFAAGTSVVVELFRDDPHAGDVVALAAGAPPVVLAHGAQLVATASGRAAFLVEGALGSVKVDGTGPVDLGGGDHNDAVAEVRDDKLLVTLHDGAKGDVRLTSIDGASRVDVGQPAVAETAFGTVAGRIVLTRETAAGAVIVSTTTAGSDERQLTTPELAARPLGLLPDGSVLFAGAAGALAVAGPAGGRPRILDGAAGDSITVSHIAGDRVVYSGVTEEAMSLRSAKLDGSGHAVLCEKAFWLPYALAVTADQRVVFHRALAGQLEGGQVFSVGLDGSDLRPLGTHVLDAAGAMRPDGPIDQDFEAVTPAGRVILEAEFEGQGSGSLLVAAPDTSTARPLTGFSAIRFAALVP